MDESYQDTSATETQLSAVESVSSVLRGRVDPSEAALVVHFAELFLAKAPPEFFEGRTPETVASLVLSAFRHLQASRPDRVDVEVVNAADDVDPWEARVTVIRTNVSERPFVVDSIREYLHSQQVAIERFLHPVLRVARDANGDVIEIGPASSGDPRESLVHCEVSQVANAALAAEMGEHIRVALEDVVLSTTDFGAMVNALNETVAYLEETARRQPDRRAEVVEIQEFLRWLRQGSFIFLGYRGYDVDPTAVGSSAFRAGRGLGILRRQHDAGYAEPAIPDAARPASRIGDPTAPLLTLSKTEAMSGVHRRVPMDYISVKKLDAEGRVAGEQRFIGLFTSRAYSEDAERIPLLRQKLRAIIEQAGWLPESHDYKESITIFNSMPKEELFLASAAEIGKQIEAILTRYHTQEVKVTMRRDPLERGVSIMVIMPKDRYSGRARRALQKELVRQFEGSLLNYHLVMGGGDQARLHFYITASPERLGGVVPEQIENTVRQMIRTWTDRLEAQLLEERPAHDAHRLAERWGAAFSEEYQAATPPDEAVADMDVIEAMEAGDRAVALRLSNPALPAGAGEAVTRLNVYLRGERLVLSDFMPILENLGLRIIAMSPFEVKDTGVTAATINVFTVQGGDGQPLDLDGARGLLTEAVLAARSGDACNDAMNALVLSAGLRWREVDVLRAYSEYAFQLKVVPSRMAVSTALRAYPESARLLVAMFRAKFDPAAGGTLDQRRRRVDGLQRDFVQSLHRVTALGDDRTLRRLATLVDATVRTNYYIHGGAEPTVRSGGVPYISFKFLGELLQPLVRTRLRADIWVQSSRMAGVHLRTGKVSRGGLRHSDRPDDFRTEVLGLVRTQAVKNAVIVPAGSKGGFVIRRHPTEPKELAAEVEAQYRTLIRGLLDITDNLVDGEVARPDGLVAFDEVDPYLVVAADKGTAKFSDVANSVAAEYGFWLDDAFASGGSNGYDHKAFGITARGAWECVRRQFRELGRDIQTEPFTVVGIGDMSGDVFGNGMLLSRQIRLLAAFDHRHIFVDPDPDPATSFVERQRIYDLGRSSWADYDTTLLSRGGFIVPRGVKEVELSAEARAALGVTDDLGPMDGETLIRAILRAPVDLLWNGGIGTYVKATGETHTDAGDTANDAVRVDASELRCRVLGEGGNLGLTQRGRVEFSLRGGRCYTDAIDNSGGVEMSDREVNLKILLNAAIAEGRLDRDRRNILLREWGEAVTEKVLDDNRSQSLAVSLDELRAKDGFEDFHGFMVALEQNRVMDRSMEALPSLEVLTDRRAEGQSLTKPELSVLLAYAKLTLKQALLASDVLDDPALHGYLAGYFPTEAVEVAGNAALAGHRLRQEIIATELGNDMVDLMGASFVYRLSRDTSRDAAAVARAWYIARRLCGARDLRRRLAPLEGQVPAEVTYRWLRGLARVLERTTRWVLTNVQDDRSTDRVIDEYLDGLRSLRGNFGAVVAGEERALFDTRVAEMKTLTGSDDLAESLITLRFLDQLLEILRIARDTGQPPVRVGRAYYLASELLELPRLRALIADASGGSRWDQRAAHVLGDALDRAHRGLAASVINAGGPDEPVEELLDRTCAVHARALQSFRDTLEDMAADDRPTLSALIIVVRELASLHS
jgi:glutamate dehydrogenase